MTKKTKLLWVDLEMTGLDPIEDRILEVAAIATDWDFKEIAIYEAAVKVDSHLFEQRIEAAPEFWKTFPHVREALIQQNDSNNVKSRQQVEEELLLFIAEHFDDEVRVLLAGNSIHQDRKFIDNEWPRLSKRLHYRMLDVSAWKVVFEGRYKKKFAKPDNHRAIDDIRGSIEELRYYLGKVRV